MKSSSLANTAIHAVLFLFASSAIVPTWGLAFFSPSQKTVANGHCSPVVLFSSSPEDSLGSPSTFREAEVLGLRWMQEGKHEKALTAFREGMKLPGSRFDIIRTQTVPGPSPVGGSSGGTEGRNVNSLDDFEIQAAHYNIACALARLGNVDESIDNLKKSFDAGFDNYATVRADPDLSSVHETTEFDDLMKQYEPKKGFPNPFSFFRGK